MAQSETPARDALLVKYLNEAYGKEKQLETALAAQISLAKRPQLKKGLQEHLKVTRAQSKGLQKRIKELGGKASTSDLPGGEVVAGAAGAATNLANRAIAGAKGPIQALRGSSPADNDLRNVRDSLWNEAEEIAHYDVIEAAAQALGDKETVKLAQTYRKEEERMASLLQKQIAPLMKQVIAAEVPAKERRAATTPARSTTRRTASSNGSARTSRASTASSRSTTSRAASTRSAASRTAGSAKKAAGSATKKAASTTRKPAAARATTAARKASPASPSGSTSSS
jgi:ferritin-like metal-binding protein YciE